MKTKLIITHLLTISISSCFITASAMAQTQYVQPRVDKNGTFREGHYRTTKNANRYDNLNANRYDNLNAESNGRNLYTGKIAREKDEYSNTPHYNRSNPLSTPDYGSSILKSRSNCIRDLFTNKCI